MVLATFPLCNNTRVLHISVHNLSPRPSTRPVVRDPPAWEKRAAARSPLRQLHGPRTIYLCSPLHFHAHGGQRRERASSRLVVLVFSGHRPIVASAGASAANRRRPSRCTVSMVCTSWSAVASISLVISMRNRASAHKAALLISPTPEIRAAPTPHIIGRVVSRSGPAMCRTLRILRSRPNA